MRLLILALISGCLDSSLVPCGELVCPRGTTCVAGACASPADVEACSGKADNDPCASQTQAFCHAGACRASICGDGFVAPDEVCDDGNRITGDGCSNDCRSNETCGNAVVDYIAGEQCDDGVVGLSGDGCTSSCLVEYDTWRDATPQPIGVRWGQALAEDATHAKLVAFGGFTPLGIVAETWQFDGVTWVRRHPTVEPVGRFLHAMCSSPAGGVVMFGGITTTYSDETWTWDDVAWRHVTGPGPPARAGGAMVLDTTRHRVVLFGGNHFGVQLGDTWIWDGSTWTQLTPATSPPAQSDHAMAYDSVRDRVQLFSGSGELWEFDGTSWQLRPIAGPNPFGRADPMVVYDPIHQVTVLFGGRGGPGNTEVNDTWELGATGWTKMASSPAPQARNQMGAAYFGALSMIVIQGGHSLGPFGDQEFLDGDSWSYVSTIGWSGPLPQVAPDPRSRMVLGYDPHGGRAIMYGGVGAAGLMFQLFPDTWIWDGSTWVFTETPVAPFYSSAGAVGTYDDALDALVLFNAQGETWSFAGSWVQLAPAEAPSMRFQPAMTYDAARKRIVLFGGSANAIQVAETWEFDGTTWVDRTPVVSPPPRSGAQLVYDAHREVSVLYGGQGANTILVDTWEWDGTTWTERTPAVSPPPRVISMMVYEANRERVLMFGGYNNNTYLDDTWEYDGTTWSQRVPVHSPSRRYAAAGFYDSIRGEVVMFGGRQDHDLGETWVYDHENTLDPRDRCDSAASDSDHDGLAGCADPDCWGRCTPLCPPGAPCDPTTQHCGDGTCDPVEDYLLCPADCPAP